MATKVLMFGWEFPPFISGGLGVACHDLTKALVSLGIDIKLVLPISKLQLKERTHVEIIGSSDVDIRQTLDFKTYLEFLGEENIFTIDTLLHPYITDIKYANYLEQFHTWQEEMNQKENSYRLNFTGHYGKDLLSEVIRYSRVASVIARDTAHDVIHIHDWLTVLAGIEAKKVSGKPLIYHVHALETDRSGINTNKTIYEIEKYGLDCADKIIAVSHFTKRNIVNYYHIDENKIEVVHNAVSKYRSADSVLKIKKKSGEKIVLFLGRITFQKGPDYFLEAAAKVLKKIKNVRFVIAGVGDMIYRLIDRAAQLRIGNKVHFTGFLSRVQVEELFMASDLYVMPSVSEPFGISPLEAVSFNVPVMISKQSGVSEILHNALKVDFWDIDDLANKIAGVIKYPSLHKHLFEQAAKELKHIQWEKSAEKVRDIYSSLIYNVGILHA